MKLKKSLMVLLLSAGLVMGMTGCKLDKDKILNRYEQWMEFNSRHALTKASKLKGEKTEGKDAYVGNYVAEYDCFSGEEYIFGGTGLNREAGNKLTASFTLKITSGSAAIVWIHSGSSYIIADGSDDEGIVELELGSGDNYLMLKGDNFTGTMELEVK